MADLESRVLGWLALHGSNGSAVVACALGVTEDAVEDAAIRLAAAGQIRMTTNKVPDGRLKAVSGAHEQHDQEKT